MMHTKINLVSLFSGAGGLDLGFKKAGFNIAWANEFDATIWETFQHNHPAVFLDKRSITTLSPNDVPGILQPKHRDAFHTIL